MKSPSTSPQGDLKSPSPPMEGDLPNLDDDRGWVRLESRFESRTETLCVESPSPITAQSKVISPTETTTYGFGTSPSMGRARDFKSQSVGR